MVLPRAMMCISFQSSPLMSFFNSSPSPREPTTAGFLAVADIGELSAHRQEAAAALFVDLAGVLLLRVDIGLVALQAHFDVGQFDAAKLDAAVAISRR